MQQSFREIFEKDGVDLFPELKTQYDYADYTEELYNTDDLMCVKHKLHVIDQLKNKPMMLHNLKKNYTINGGKSGGDFIITNKTSKAKYNVEFERDSISITKQTKKGQRLFDFEYFWSAPIYDLF